MRLAGVARLGAVTLVGALALSACIGDGYAYFRHSAGSSLTYFKLPASWRTFDQSQLLQAQGQTQSSDPEPSWAVAFNGAPHGTVSGIFSQHNAYPTGEVRVRELSPEEQDGYSISDLRQELLGVDPLNPGTTTTTAAPTFNVVSYSVVQDPNGFHGIHMVVDVIEPGAPTYTLNQVSLLDADSEWVYVLGIGCNITCYAKNSGVIKAVVSSWNVKEQ